MSMTEWWIDYALWPGPPWKTVKLTWMVKATFIRQMHRGQNTVTLPRTMWNLTGKVRPDPTVESIEPDDILLDMYNSYIGQVMTLKRDINNIELTVNLW